MESAAAAAAVDAVVAVGDDAAAAAAAADGDGGVRCRREAEGADLNAARMRRMRKWWRRARPCAVGGDGEGAPPSTTTATSPDCHPLQPCHCMSFCHC